MHDTKPPKVITPQTEIQQLAAEKGLTMRFIHGWVFTDPQGNVVGIVEYFNKLKSFLEDRDV